MTVFRLLLPWTLDTPEKAARYMECGADYILEVSRMLDYPVGDLGERVDNAVEAMEDGETDVDDDVADVVATVLVGDAEFYTAFIDWFPLKYRVFARPLEYTFNPRLHGVAAEYVGGDGVRDLRSEMEYSTAGDHIVDGEPAMSYVDGVGDRTVLADSVLHVEWYHDAASRLGVEVDTGLVERTLEESPRYFCGLDDELTEDVAAFQRALFRDSDWLRDVEAAYGLDSWVMTRAADAIDEAVEEL